MIPSSKYKLGFRMRFLLFMLGIFRPKTSGMSLKQIQKAREPFPIRFLAEWVLGKPIPLHEVKDRMIPVRDAEIPVRIYRPGPKKGLPVILNFHGGGWTLGNLQQSDFYCRALAKKTGMVVVSVDYRLAPENPFPVPLHDAYDSLLWVHGHAEELGIDPERIAVTGDSAGGNLSAAVSLMSRDLKGPKIRHQALIYPGTDGTFSYPSFNEHVNAPILSQADVYFYRSSYEAKEGDYLDPYFSPSLAEDLSGLPPAVVLTAGYDPLRDDGRIFHEKLLAAGNESEWTDFPRDIHGFMTLVNHSPGFEKGLDLIVRSMKKYMGGSRG